MKRFTLLMQVIVVSALVLPQSPAIGQQALVVKPLVEKKLTELPPGPLFWRLENFPTLEAAQAAASPTSLAAQSRGKTWLFTLGPAGGASAGGAKVAEIGPIPRMTATQYLLRVNEGSGPPGSITPVHSHPGSEAFYVLAGESTSRTPHGVMRVGSNQGATGHGTDTPMQVSSTGSVDLQSLVMFVVDASRPFSSPASFP